MTQEEAERLLELQSLGYTLSHEVDDTNDILKTRMIRARVVATPPALGKLMRASQAPAVRASLKLIGEQKMTTAEKIAEEILLALSPLVPDELKLVLGVVVALIKSPDGVATAAHRATQAIEAKAFIRT